MRLLVILFLTKSLYAQTVKIITPEELRASSYIVFDARERKLFRNGHVPESRRLDWREWTDKKPGFWNKLFGFASRFGKVPDRNEKIQSRLRKLGLSNQDRIAVLGLSPGWGAEGRIAWNFLYWGAETVALLDGGYKAWINAYPNEIEKGKSSFKAKTGDFIVATKSSRRATKAQIRSASHWRKNLILDSRTESEFNGEKEWAQKRGGRIPGSHLINYKKLYNKRGEYISAKALKQMLPEGSLENVMTYCTGGVRSALLALLIEARLGHQVANYEASMWEWSADPLLPIEK